MPYHGDGVANGADGDANAAAAILAAAIDYRTRRGWAVIPVPLGSKNPGRTGWQRLDLPAETLADYFGRTPQNIGVLFGAPSGNVADVDLDIVEAVRLAPYFLPATDCCFGRLSKPRSHHCYQVVGDLSTKKFTDPLAKKDEAMLLELRSSGTQTIVPPSIHPSGEAITWDQDGDPTRIAAADLLAAGGRLAAAALLARYWPEEGVRNMAALALAGGLLRAGWPEAEVERFVTAVAWAAGDEEARDRGDAAPYTARALAAERPATGWPKLADVIDPRVIDRAREWLGLRDKPVASLALTPASPANGSDPSCSRPAAVVVPPSPPFPIATLPPEVAQFVTEHAAAIGVPPDMVGVPLLVFAAAIIGRTGRLRIKRGFDQRPILWAAVVGRPGTAKSPALGASHKIVEMLQAEAYHEFTKAMAEYRRALKEDDDAAPSKPVLEHFYTTDSTKEALAVMAEHSPGLVIVRDELVAWIENFDAYRGGRGGDRADFLALWAGSGMKIDRKKDEPIVVPEPTICVVGGIQPDLLPRLRNDAGNDGFLDRMLFCYPDAGVSEFSFAEVADATERALLDRFRTLRGEGPAPDVVSLGPDARQRWQTWMRHNEDLIAVAEPHVAGIYTKLTNQCARLALVLHCLWDPDRTSATLSRERLDGAIALTEYFRVQALRVLPLLGALSAPSMPALAGLPGRVLRILEDNSAWVGRTQLYRRLSNAVEADALSDALATLRNLGRVEQRMTRSRTRPAEQWRVIPTPRPE